MSSARRVTVAMVALLLCAPVLSGQARSDSAAIRQLYRDWPRAVEAGNAVGFMAFIDDSITVLVPGAAPIQGAAVYRAGISSMFRSAAYRVRLEPPRRLQVAGSWAFVQYSGVLVTLPG